MKKYDPLVFVIKVNKEYKEIFGLTLQKQHTNCPAKLCERFCEQYVVTIICVLLT